MKCPRCGAHVYTRDVDTIADVAPCRACGVVTQLSAAAHPLDPTSPPPAGAWDIDDGVERRIGTSTRSWWALLVVPLFCIASGAGATMYGSQVISGRFDPCLSVAGLWVLFAAAWLAQAAAMLTFGHVEIRLRGVDALVFSGVGSLGRTRRFRTTEFSRIREDKYAWWWSRDLRFHIGPRRPPIVIILEGTRRLNIGWFLGATHRRFILESLRPLIGTRT